LAPGPFWTGAENLATTGIRSPDPPARSESLYRLSYPGPHYTLPTCGKLFLYIYIYIYIYHCVKCGNRYNKFGKHIYLLNVIYNTLSERLRISVVVKPTSLNSPLTLYRWFNLTAMLPLFSQHPVLISTELHCFSTTGPSEVCEM